MWREVWWDGRCLGGVGGLAMLLFGQNGDSASAEEFKGSKLSGIGTLSKMLTLLWRDRRTALKGLFTQHFTHSTNKERYLMLQIDIRRIKRTCFDSLTEFNCSSRCVKMIKWIDQSVLYYL